MKGYLVTVFLLFFFISLFAQNDKRDYTDAFKLIEAWLDAQKDYEQLPGISASIIHDQEVLWSGAFGMANVEGKINTQPSTICSICSISKLFTSVAIMKLYDEGKLRLDDKVNDLLPWYNLKQKYPDSGPITVRSLLTHSSGLPREANFPYWNGPDFPFPTEEQVRAEMREQETLYPSSTYFQYSNLGLTLLGEIVAQVSGVPYAEYVREQILEPLNLIDTHPELPESLYGNKLAIGYSAITRENHREKVAFFQARGITPAAGFSSNVLDLGKFASWQFRLMDSTMTEILKPSTLKYMQNVHWTDPDWKSTWGLGFSVSKGADGEKWVGHGGSCPGYRSSLQLNPKSKMAYVVMINANGTSPGKYINGIHEILKKVKDLENNANAKNNIEEKDLSEYVGYYSQMPWWGESYISTWGNQLVELTLPTPSSPGEAMTFFKHISGDTFQRIRNDGEFGEMLVFERDASGRIKNAKQHEYYSDRIER